MVHYVAEVLRGLEIRQGTQISSPNAKEELAARKVILFLGSLGYYVLSPN